MSSRVGEPVIAHRAGRPTAVLLKPGSPTPSGLGGKGGSLAVLVAAGHPVPSTGVATTEAYRQVVADPGLSALVSGIVAGGDIDAEAVDAAFASAPIDEELAADLVQMARQVGNGGPIAVRSSATVEDLHGSSFAGQYQSVLNVDSADPDAVLDAIRRVWASLWHPAPTAYRRAFGIDDSDVAMAVVLMEMIPATTAGVVFTTDPAGSADDARVEAVEGLGEALVSGERTPTAWVVARDHSTELPTVPARALELALAIEAMAGVPQDVEWAALDDEVVVVQARPITVLETDDGFDTELDDHELTTAGIVEMVPGVLAPLRWELNRFLLEEAFRSVLDSLGIIRGSAAEDRPFVRRVRGRAAIDFDQLRAAASAVPGAVEELERQYFGTEAAPSAVTSKPRGLGALLRDLRTLRTRRRVIEAAEVLVRTVQELRTRRPDLATLDDQDVLAYIRRLTDLAARGLAAELGVAASGAAAYRRLEQILGSHLGPESAPAAVQAITGDTSSNDVRSVHASAAVFAGPTWSEIGSQPPERPPRNSGAPQESLRALEQQLKALPGWRRHRILTGQFVDIRIHLIRRTVFEVVDQLRRREASKSAFLELGGEVRRAHLELGERLLARGLLQDADEVELLSSTELVAACHQHEAPGADLLGRRRNWLRRYDVEGQLPVRFTGVPEREALPLPEGDVLAGWAASPGRTRGVATVVRSPQDRIGRGEILVAEATDASWSPLFVMAGGVVVERGGPLSHAAILARELGLPAVLNVAGATQVLDGCIVSVDGDQGLVVIEARGAQP